MTSPYWFSAFFKSRRRTTIFHLLRQPRLSHLRRHKSPKKAKKIESDVTVICNFTELAELANFPERQTLSEIAQHRPRGIILRTRPELVAGLQGLSKLHPEVCFKNPQLSVKTAALKDTPVEIQGEKYCGQGPEDVWYENVDLTFAKTLSDSKFVWQEGRADTWFPPHRALLLREASKKPSERCRRRGVVKTWLNDNDKRQFRILGRPFEKPCFWNLGENVRDLRPFDDPETRLGWGDVSIILPAKGYLCPGYFTKDT